jgi:hypothetical protein
MMFSGFIKNHVSLNRTKELDDIREHVRLGSANVMNVSTRTMLLRFTPMVVAEDDSKIGKNLLHIVG